MIIFRIIHSAIWWTCNTIIVVIAGIVVPASRPFDKKERITMFAAYFWARAMLFLAGCKLVVEGRDILEETGQSVLICNHQSYFDIFVVIALLGRPPHFLAKKELFSIPIFGQLMRIGRVLEIDRQRPLVAVATIKKALEEGFNRHVVIFPEGTRSTDGVMQPFRRRGITLLAATKLPFLPVGIGNSRNIMPKGNFLVKPGKIGLVIGKPIPPPEITEENLHQHEIEGFMKTLWTEVHLLQENACQLVNATPPTKG